MKQSEWSNPEVLCGIVKHSVEQTFSMFLDSNEKILQLQDRESLGSSKQIAGITQIRSQVSLGWMLVRLNEDTAFRVLSEIYKKEMSGLNDFVADGVGEITNVIFGGAKKQLNNFGLNLEMAIPVVAVGHNIHSLFSRSSSILEFPFSAHFGAIQVDVVLDLAA